MSAKRKRRNPYSWQIKRLADFIRTETDEARFYEVAYEKMARKIPFKVLTVMIFFINREYVKKPGSILTLFRTMNAIDPSSMGFETRFARYYEALQERRFV